jgi:hypothetical protein
MHRIGYLKWLVLAAALIAPLASTGCAVRVHDGYGYRDDDHYRDGYRYFYQLGFSHMGDHGNWNIDQLVRR